MLLLQIKHVVQNEMKYYWPNHKRKCLKHKGGSALNKVDNGKAKYLERKALFSTFLCGMNGLSD